MIQRATTGSLHNAVTANGTGFIKVVVCINRVGGILRSDTRPATRPFGAFPTVLLVLGEVKVAPRQKGVVFLF